MTNLKQQIIAKISDISFANGSKLKDSMSEIVIKGNNIGFSVDVSGQDLIEAEQLKQQAIASIREILAIDKITIVFTKSDITDQKPPEQRQHGKTKHLIDNVRKLILVTAGKGGVGKSTISALIAERLTSLNYKVGIVDADIYGPSMPQIFGVNDLPEIQNNKMIPLLSRNIKIISIGFLNQSVIAWRGPMVSKAIYQLLSLTAWGELDYLIIDTPPGTGDIHLSILENYKVDGAIIVTTPQQISQIDVKKSIDLYIKFDIPILGVIENMSYFTDQNGNNIQIFTGNSGASLSLQYDIPLIAKVPLLPELATSCDQGLALCDIINLPIERFL